MAYNDLFFSYVEGYQNLDVGLVDSFEVTGLAPDTGYYCRVRAANGTDTGPNSGSVHISTLYAGFEEPKLVIPSFIISPNPVNENLLIRYKIDIDEFVGISLYNHLGQLIETIQQGFQSSGQNQIRKDLSLLPTGIYFLKITAGDITLTKKIIKL